MNAIRVMNSTGDSEIVAWEPGGDLTAAREVFASLQRTHHMMYQVAEGATGGENVVLHDFNSQAETIVAVPYVVGG